MVDKSEKYVLLSLLSTVKSRPRGPFQISEIDPF